MTQPNNTTDTELDIFSDEYLAFATLLKEKEPELWKYLYDRKLIPKLCKIHAILAAQEANRARSEGKIDAAIQLDPYIAPEFRQQYEYIFGTYEEKQAQLTQQNKEKSDE